ncbi:MAG: hypothetical protein QXR60_01130 [Candidatus Nanoarchaeia archaeon]
MRRGQMEMVGLVIIVVLLIFGGLIYLWFKSIPPDKSLAETRQSSEVKNLLDSMMKVTPCPDTEDSLDDIILNGCYLFNGNREYCGNPDCKNYIMDVVSNVTKSYNPKWQYVFNVTDPTGKPFISQGSCTLTKRMASDTTIRVGNKVLTVKLVACMEL